jgi:hypothetical protein
MTASDTVQAVRRAEYGQHRGAHHVDHRPAEMPSLLAHPLGAAVRQRMHIPRAQPLREGGEPSQVGKQHRRPMPLIPHARVRRLSPRRRRGLARLAQRRATLATEPLARPGLRAAGSSAAAAPRNPRRTARSRAPRPRTGCIACRTSPSRKLPWPLAPFEAPPLWKIPTRPPNPSDAGPTWRADRPMTSAEPGAPRSTP